MFNKDPLGIYRAINDTELKHKETPITKDQYDEWLAHPVTKRLHEELACTAVMSRLQANAVDMESIEKRIALIESSVLENVIDWEPRSVEVHDEQD